jgi:hypothetical protein
MPETREERARKRAAREAVRDELIAVAVHVTAVREHLVTHPESERLLDDLKDWLASRIAAQKAKLDGAAETS